MKKTNSILRNGKALFLAVFAGALFLLSAGDMYAQQSAAGTLNPYTHIATKLDVTAYPLGTFERTHTMDILENIVEGLKQLVGSGGGTSDQKLKYNYCNKMLADIHTNYISPEITLLTSLSALTAETSTTEIQQSQLRTLYNQIVSQLQ